VNVGRRDEEPGVGRAEFQYPHGSDCKLDQ
jgi:hypothetical protein